MAYNDVTTPVAFFGVFFMTVAIWVDQIMYSFCSGNRKVLPEWYKPFFYFPAWAMIMVPFATQIQSSSSNSIEIMNDSVRDLLLIFVLILLPIVAVSDGAIFLKFDTKGEVSTCKRWIACSILTVCYWALWAILLYLLFVAEQYLGLSISTVLIPVSEPIYFFLAPRSDKTTLNMYLTFAFRFLATAGYVLFGMAIVYIL